MEIQPIVDILVSVLFLPELSSIFHFAWGTHDTALVATLKRIFLLLPVLSLVVAYWSSVMCFLSVLVRTERRSFLSALFMNWWELGRALFHFWGGSVKFVGHLFGFCLGLIRIGALGLFSFIKDLLMAPISLAGGMGRKLANPSVAWVAVGLTLFWCTLEAIIFTYVTGPLVVDTLSNMTGEQLPTLFLRVPLFVFMLFIVLGSYAVLSSWTDALKKRDVGSILRIGVIEAVALFVEVMFLYREFVDALVPWFAQHASGFELGIAGTLAIAGFTWFGIRGLSWFLFASSGTPPILAVIQGKGLKTQATTENKAEITVLIRTRALVSELRGESNWIKEQGDLVIAAFLIPPLQLVAVSVNFLTFLLTKNHAFTLPFEKIDDLYPDPHVAPEINLVDVESQKLKKRKAA